MFRIGFPVDGGDENSSFIVLVRLIHGAEFHSCVGGGKSDLRKNSGASYVFERFSEYIQSEYRFQFELIPGLSEEEKEVSPENFCSAGTSDSVACALAIEQHDIEVGESQPIILVSCSFIYKSEAYGLKSLKLQKVTKEDADKALKSLLNKWHTACKNNALALILHQYDAKLLAKAITEKIIPLDKIDFNNKKSSPCIVSCASDQWPLLKKKLYTNNKRKSMFWAAVVSCLILLSVLAWMYEKPVNTREKGKKRETKLNLQNNVWSKLAKKYKNKNGMRLVMDIISMDRDGNGKVSKSEWDDTHHVGIRFHQQFEDFTNNSIITPKDVEYFLQHNKLPTPNHRPPGGK